MARGATSWREVNVLNGLCFAEVPPPPFEPAPARLSTNAAAYHFELAPQQMTSLFIAVSCNNPLMHKPAPFFRGMLAHRREMRRSSAGATSTETSNNIFNEVLCQAVFEFGGIWYVVNSNGKAIKKSD